MKFRVLSLSAVACLLIANLAFAQTKPAPAGGAPAASAPSSSAVGLTTAKQKASYGIGMELGNNLKQQQVEVDLPALIKGLSDGQTGAKQAISAQELDTAMQEFQKEHVARVKELRATQGEKNKKEGADFLAANKNKEGVKTTPSGLQYKVIKSGAGVTPTASDTVTAHYKGTLLDGSVFDSSYDRNEPITIPANAVIKGWTEALTMMKVGDKWQLFIPAELAYGEKGAGGAIGPNAVLQFDVELLDVKKGQGDNSMQLPPMNSQK